MARLFIYQSSFISQLLEFIWLRLSLFLMASSLRVAVPTPRGTIQAKCRLDGVTLLLLLLHLFLHITKPSIVIGFPLVYLTRWMTNGAIQFDFFNCVHVMYFNSLNILCTAFENLL